MITVGIYGEQKIICEGIETLFQENEHITVKFICFEKAGLNEMIKHANIHILIMHINDVSTPVLNRVLQLNIHFPKVKILILSTYNSEELIFKAIKAGAKGFLSQESGKKELFEAVYTIRNGHDYYSKSITQLLLNKYVSRIKSNDDNDQSNISSLSQRQVEILKLWGESYTNQEIADRLFISIRTVESHKNHIMQKLNLKTTVDMVKFAIKNNLIDI